MSSSYPFTWLKNGSPLFAQPEHLAASALLPSYLHERDERSRLLHGTHQGVSGRLLAAVWQIPTASATTIASYQKLIWDKYFHAGHISLAPSNCSYCQVPSGLQHIICFCSQPSLQAERQRALQAAGGLIADMAAEARPVAQFLYGLLSHPSWALRVWTSAWNDDILQQLDLLPCFCSGATSNLLLHIRTQLLPVLRLLACYASRLWSTHMMSDVIDNVNPYYAPHFLRRMHSLHDFLLKRPIPSFLGSKRKHSVDGQGPSTKQTRISSFYLPLVAVPEIPPTNWLPDEVPSGLMDVELDPPPSPPSPSPSPVPSPTSEPIHRLAGESLVCYLHRTLATSDLGVQDSVPLSPSLSVKRAGIG